MRCCRQQGAEFFGEVEQNCAGFEVRATAIDNRRNPAIGIYREKFSLFLFARFQIDGMNGVRHTQFF